MKKLMVFCVYLLSVTLATAQSREALEGNHTLKERYEIMKDKAESYNDYKVIKNVILDGFWKINMDSMAKVKSDLHTANATIAKLKGEIQGAADKVKAAETAMEQSSHERTHMNVFGMPVAKGVFVTTSLIIVAALVIALLTVLSTFNVLRRSNREKELTIHGIMSEFDAFRKKALEKEVKISRELQSERNKLSAKNN
jgi:outer membrane murein-binding lipoprotein Lpp